MDDLTLNIYLSRILSGVYVFIHKDKTYKLKYPDMHTKYLADLLCKDEYEKNKFNDWILEEDILNLLMVMGIWNPSLENEFKELPAKIENSKIELYKSLFNPPHQKKIRKQLETHKKRLDFLHSHRHSLDHLTAKGYCDSLKHQYVLMHSFYDENDQKIFHSLDTTNLMLFNALSAKISNDTISSESFRKIARSDLWRNYWSSNKSFVFNKATVDWTDEQRTLVMITRMYDNCYEHPEAPAENVFEDDDMFDGWMLTIKKESEKEKSKRRTEKMFGDKMNKAGEVFLMANSKEEAQNIYGLNDNQSRHIIKEREQAIKNKNTINDMDLPDVQREIKMQTVQAIKERRSR